MRTRAATVGFLALLLMGGTSSFVRAEESPATPAPAIKDAADEGEDLEYTFGTVKSVDGGQIVISEFDYDTGQEKEAAYEVDPKAELSNVKSLQEIKVGDEVDVDYRVEGEKKIAQAIAVAKPLQPETTEGGS